MNRQQGCERVCALHPQKLESMQNGRWRLARARTFHDRRYQFGKQTQKDAANSRCAINVFWMLSSESVLVQRSELLVPMMAPVFPLVRVDMQRSLPQLDLPGLFSAMIVDNVTCSSLPRGLLPLHDSLCHCCSLCFRMLRRLLRRMVVQGACEASKLNGVDCWLAWRLQWIGRVVSKNGARCPVILRPVILRVLVEHIRPISLCGSRSNDAQESKTECVPSHAADCGERRENGLFRPFGAAA